jgi:phenylalanyl-tRNA synthetase beta subunit
VKDIKLPKLDVGVGIDKSFSYKEKIRRILYEEGFSEVINYSFVPEGEIELLNPMSPEKKYLRTNLSEQMKECLEFNSRYSDFIDMPQIKVFEFGHVFTKDGEFENFIIGVKNPLGLKKPKEKEVLDDTLNILFEKLGIKGDQTKSQSDGTGNIAEFNFAEILKSLPEATDYEMSEAGDKTRRYKKISPYPFMIRDVAVFTPEGTSAEEVLEIINKEGGDLMIKNRLFDVFTKTFEDGSKKTSYAYRIIFQSYEKTLSDTEVNTIMERITNKMNTNKGWLVR